LWRLCPDVLGRLALRSSGEPWGETLGAGVVSWRQWRTCHVPKKAVASECKAVEGATGGWNDSN